MIENDFLQLIKNSTRRKGILFCIILFVVCCTQSIAQQSEGQAKLDSLQNIINKGKKRGRDSSTGFFIDKIRGGVQIRAQRAIFSLTNTFLFRINRIIDLGVGSGIEYYDVSGNSAAMVQVPVMVNAHIYLSNNSYLVIEPMYMIPVSAWYVDSQSKSVDYPTSIYKNTLAGGFGYGRLLTDKLSFEVYLRGNKFGLEHADNVTPIFIGINLAYFIN